MKSTDLPYMSKKQRKIDRFFERVDHTDMN